MRNIIVVLTIVAFSIPALAQPPLRPVEIVHLDHLDARSTVDIVARLLGPEGVCAPHAETNSLILIDDAPHVTRIREVIVRLEERAARRRPRAARRR